MAGRRSVIPDNHLAAIGHVAYVAGSLDFQIDIGIWKLVGAPQQLTACLTAQMISALPKLKAFSGLLQVLGASEETVRKVNTLTGEVAGLLEKRNRIVHDARWVHQRTGETARLQITAKPKVHFGFVHETDEEVHAVADALAGKIREFIEIRDAAIDEIASLLEKSEPQLSEIIPAP